MEMERRVEDTLSAYEYPLPSEGQVEELELIEHVQPGPPEEVHVFGACVGEVDELVLGDNGFDVGDTDGLEDGFVVVG